MFDFVLDSKGYIRKRETFDLEFKQNIQLGDNLLKYLKSLIGMANNRGGEIIFGIKDSPHEPIGMTNNKFRDVDPSTIDRYIREYFSGEVLWHMEILEHYGKEFGRLSVEEARIKPIICKKNKNEVLREGAIYYRYRAETKEIEYVDLTNLLNSEKEKEKLLWIKHVTKVAAIGIRNTQLIDLNNGILPTHDGDFILDKGLLENLKFIKEGEFKEKGGAPALKVIGEIKGFIETEAFVDSDKVYMYFLGDLFPVLNISKYELQCLIWKLNIKGNSKYHTAIQAGNNSNSINKYSQLALDYLAENVNKEFIERCKKEYKQAHPPVSNNRSKRK
ncbi:AlbA family DNA-binding domain-containing protein [Emticicia fontis]